MAVAPKSADTQQMPPTRADGFSIAERERAGSAEAPVFPDAATCEHCLRELFDPADRRFRYPFINCSNCGPRFTIVRGVPYARSLTTMAPFVMCEKCRAEYENPLDRRFHAQAIACWDCGPQVTLLDSERRLFAGGDAAVRGAAAALRAGAVVAIKGVGGYHIACLAGAEDSVAEVRAHKNTEEKPFALMAPSVDAALELVSLSRNGRRLLVGAERPIVIARRRAEAPVADAVAPRSRELGVMLPHSPLHHLLLAEAGATLVMTSGNLSDEPIAHLDDEALRRLRRIVDLFLVHDRPIQTRADDSVLRPSPRGRAPVFIRRSRGFAPGQFSLPVAAPRPVLACGAEPVAVQHHHAHMAACLAEHGLEGPAIGVIYDGIGYGADGTCWGGELLVGDLRSFERAGHLWPVRLPAGEGAMRRSWRMASAWTTAAFGEETSAPAAIDVTTSMGQLLDAIAALCGLQLAPNDGGQAAAELAAVSDWGETEAHPLCLISEGDAVILDARPTIRALLSDLEAGCPVPTVAGRFHNAVAVATTAAVSRIARERGVRDVVLSGECFENTLLLERASTGLHRAGLRVLVPERLPPNDGGISYGQAAVAAARDAASATEPAPW